MKTQLFTEVISDIKDLFSEAPLIHNKKWQSVASPQHTYEILNHSFSLNVPPTDITSIAEIVKPNLPWADHHFELERVGGDPLNPGTTWREWPYAGSAAKHRREGSVDPQFDHSYAERYWPRYAGLTPDGRLNSLDEGVCAPLHGIRFDYGDLRTLIEVLSEDSTTRQAYLPVWFPEDLTAAKMGKRVPCSLGYHFIVRGDYIHMVYYLRSCDFVRHFRDDVYLSIRLLLWVLEQVGFIGIKPGTFTMHITSLHMFQSDRKFALR
jgi:hypothetical protein